MGICWGSTESLALVFFNDIFISRGKKRPPQIVLTRVRLLYSADTKSDKSDGKDDCNKVYNEYLGEKMNTLTIDITDTNNWRMYIHLKTKLFQLRT